MKLTKCDRHPERDAVATFKIHEMPVGSRPFIFVYDYYTRVIDLCQDCAELVRPLTPQSKPGAGAKS